MVNGSLFLLFLISATCTVASPGPGVLLTLTSAIRYGLAQAFYVILGTASGTIIMAAISSTGLGLLIAASPAAFEFIKILGGCYMVFLGVRLYRAKPFSFDLAAKEKPVKTNLMEKGKLWLQGVTLQMTNPMLIMFFVSLFPQFIDPALNMFIQVSAMSLTYFCIVVVIHLGYAWIVSNFRQLLSTPKAARVINCIGGTIFILSALRVFWNTLMIS